MRILYLSHCDWGWARQRPQHLASALAEYGHEVHVRYRPFLRRKGLVTGPTQSDSRLAGLRAAWWLVPTRWATRNRMLLAISKLAIKFVSWRVRPDVVWYSSPELQPVAVVPGIPTVWDCMDLTSLIRIHDGKWSARVRALEGVASQSAAAVLASSEALAAEVARQSEPDKVFKVNNGYLAGFDWTAEPAISDKIVGGYFGTVAEWFDFDLVLELLAAEPRLEFRIIGPCTVEIPDHPRLQHVGPLPHSDLPAATTDVSFFIMPFRVDKLIEAVDPVKLYEYVASGRPALAPHYREVEKFRPFVSLYQSNVECLSLVQQILAGHRSPDPVQKRADFLSRNSWTERAGEATEALDWAVR